MRGLTGGKTDKKATKKQQFVDCFCLRPGRACAILVSVLRGNLAEKRNILGGNVFLRTIASLNQ